MVGNDASTCRGYRNRVCNPGRQRHSHSLEAAAQGRSGVGYTTLFDASRFPTKISAEVKNFNLADYGEDPREWDGVSRHNQVRGRGRTASLQGLGARGQGRRSDALWRLPWAVAKGRTTSPALPRWFSRDSTATWSMTISMPKKGLEVLDRQAELEQEPNLPAAHWPDCSTLRGRTQTASPPVPPVAKRSAKRPR